MSRQVTVDYQGVSIEIQAQCETAIHSLCRIDKALEYIRRCAKKLETAKVREYEQYLLDSKRTIQNEIGDFQEVLNKYNKQRTTVEEGSHSYYEFEKTRRDLRARMSKLNDSVNELTGEKLEAIRAMISQGLLDAGQTLIRKVRGELNVSMETLDKINAIKDVSLRDLTYREYVAADNKDASFEALLRSAEKKYERLVNDRTKEVVAEYKKELQDQGVEADALDKATSVAEATAITSAAIKDEKVRRETLKIIIKAIRARGFIVDTKRNLKIDRARNVVKLVTLKPSGQKAEFEIKLDGHFMYRFDRYEGQACKKDIEPFLEDLRNVYDIKILREETVWENPDKIQTQKYQYVKKNEGTN